MCYSACASAWPRAILSQPCPCTSLCSATAQGHPIPELGTILSLPFKQAGHSTTRAAHQRLLAPAPPHPRPCTTKKQVASSTQAKALICTQPTCRPRTGVTSALPPAPRPSSGHGGSCLDADSHGTACLWQHGRDLPSPGPWPHHVSPGPPQGTGTLWDMGLLGRAGCWHGQDVAQWLLCSCCRGPCASFTSPSPSSPPSAEIQDLQLGTASELPVHSPGINKGKSGGNSLLPGARPHWWPPLHQALFRQQQRSMGAAKHRAGSPIPVPAPLSAPLDPAAPPCPNPMRGTAKGLRGFPPPNLQQQVPGLLQADSSPQGSQLNAKVPSPSLEIHLALSGGPAVSVCLAAQAAGADSQLLSPHLAPIPGPDRLLKRLPPLLDVPRAFPGWGSPGKWFPKDCNTRTSPCEQGQPTAGSGCSVHSGGCGVVVGVRDHHKGPQHL